LFLEGGTSEKKKPRELGKIYPRTNGRAEKMGEETADLQKKWTQGVRENPRGERGRNRASIGEGEAQIKSEGLARVGVEQGAGVRREGLA